MTYPSVDLSPTTDVVFAVLPLVVRVAAVILVVLAVKLAWNALMTWLSGSPEEVQEAGMGDLQGGGTRRPTKLIGY